MDTIQPISWQGKPGWFVIEAFSITCNRFFAAITLSPSLCLIFLQLKQYLEPCFDFQVCSTRGTSDCVDTSLMLVLFHSLTLFDEYMQQFKRGLFAPTPAGRSFSSSSVHHLCSPTEAYALLQFRQSFQISDYFSCWDYESWYYDCPRTKSWNESRDCCSWDGVTCDLLNGHVIGLDPSCSLLGGSIHPNSSLFQLHHLHTLNLAYNNFNHSSSIPHNIGRLRILRHLNLSWSYFDGKIPTEISYLSNLVSLDLSGYDLQLEERTFEAMLQNLTNLEVLSLSYVNISSPIPVNMSSSLRHVNLQSTNLQGVLTESFFLLPNLETLKLGYNDLLKGVLPKIHPSSTLLELSIAHTGISGELPHSIGTLSSLNILYLQGCQFSGYL